MQEGACAFSDARLIVQKGEAGFRHVVGRQIAVLTQAEQDVLTRLTAERVEGTLQQKAQGTMAELTPHRIAKEVPQRHLRVNGETRSNVGIIQQLLNAAILHRYEDASCSRSSHVDHFTAIHRHHDLQIRDFILCITVNRQIHFSHTKNAHFLARYDDKTMVEAAINDAAIQGNTAHLQNGVTNADVWKPPFLTPHLPEEELVVRSNSDQVVLLYVAR